MTGKIGLIILCFMLLSMSMGAQINGDPEVGIDEQLGQFLPLELEFKDSNGNTVALKDLIRKPTVLSFVYYHCPTVCKPLLGAKVDVLNRIGLVPGKDYEALTISFNEDETPKNAKIIKDHFLNSSKQEIPPDAWHFLTGTKENIDKVTSTAGFHFKRDGRDFIHPTGLIMVSPKGKITRYIYGMSYLPFDVKLALIEASSGKIGPTIGRLLLYCFRYDPEGKKYVFNILKVTATVTLFFLALFVGWLMISTARRKQKLQKTRDEKEDKIEDEREDKKKDTGEDKEK